MPWGIIKKNENNHRNIQEIFMCHNSQIFSMSHHVCPVAIIVICKDITGKLSSMMLQTSFQRCCEIQWVTSLLETESKFPKLTGKSHGWHHFRNFQSFREKSHGWHHSRNFQSLQENPVGDITLGISKAYEKKMSDFTLRIFPACKLKIFLSFLLHHFPLPALVALPLACWLVACTDHATRWMLGFAQLLDKGKHSRLRIHVLLHSWQGGVSFPMLWVIIAVFSNWYWIFNLQDSWFLTI